MLFLDCFASAIRWAPAGRSRVLFQLIPDPALNDVSWLPRWLAGWADRFGNLRTAVPFLLLGLLGGYRLRKTQYPPRTWWGVWGALLALVTLVEVGQSFLPLRHCDWRDIAWGSVGAAAGMLPFWLRRQRGLATKDAEITKEGEKLERRGPMRRFEGSLFLVLGSWFLVIEGTWELSVINYWAGEHRRPACSAGCPTRCWGIGEVVESS